MKLQNKDYSATCVVHIMILTALKREILQKFLLVRTSFMASIPSPFDVSGLFLYQVKFNGETVIFKKKCVNFFLNAILKSENHSSR